MLTTSLSPFPTMFSTHSKNRFFLSYIYFVVCKCFPFGPVQFFFLFGRELRTQQYNRQPFIIETSSISVKIFLINFIRNTSSLFHREQEKPPSKILYSMPFDLWIQSTATRKGSVFYYEERARIIRGIPIVNANRQFNKVCINGDRQFNVY